MIKFLNPSIQHLLRGFSVWIVILFGQTGLSQNLEISFPGIPDQVTLPLITGIDQDERGYIWLAASDLGFIRYDGNSFKTYSPGAHNDLGYSVFRFECMLADPGTGIWAGDFNSGLFLLDPYTERFTHFLHDPVVPGTLSSSEIRAILRDSRGTLWIGTRAGLDTLDRSTGRFHKVEYDSDDGLNLAQAHVRAIYEDSDGIIWVGCGAPHPGDDLVPEANGLYRLDIPNGSMSRYTHVENDTTSISDNRVRVIFEDSRGVFWIGTAGEDGLHTLNRETGKFRQYRYNPDHPQKLSRPPLANAEDLITFINEDSEGFIWIGTLISGMNRYDPVSQTVEHFGTEETGRNKVDRNDHWVSLKARDGSLWVTSNWNTGRTDRRLLKIEANPPELHFTDLGKIAASFYQGEDSVLWMGTNFGLDRVDKNGNTETYLMNPESPNLPENAVPFLEKGPSDSLFLSTFNGLWAFRTRTKTSREIDFGHDNIPIRVTHYNPDHTLWIGSSLGLDLYDLTSGEVTHFHGAESDTSKIRTGEIRSIVVDHQGNTWVAGFAGLYRIYPDRASIEVVLSGMFSEGRAFIDSDQTVWLSAEKNMFHYNPEFRTLENVKAIETFITNEPPSLMMEYQPGLFLIKCGNGFILYDKELQKTSYVGESWFQRQIIDRMIFKTFDGDILAGTNYSGIGVGYYRFRPEGFVKKGMNPRPFISRVYINGDPLTRENPGGGEDESSPNLALDYDQNNLTFEFDAVDFISKGKERLILFQLEGLDTEWRQNLGEHKSYYYGLPPGDYTFKVKATNRYGEWGDAAFPLVISPPWYLTWWAYIGYGLILVLGVFTVDRIQRRRLLQKERERTQQMELAQAREIEKAYNQLKETQQQLIQSEKMASLGELTAGIAHEIQNPLNFVNNFSDVNTELIEELKEAIQKGNLREVEEIANDLKENEQKIVHHGKRAEEIVRSMLQHSRGTEGKKEPTDINALADEYLRLAFHGMRAKDKSFNVEMKTDFDDSIKNIEVVPQDIGRVILNLITNAFHAVAERKANDTGGYQPEVSIRTEKTGKEIRISVSDNGSGIPGDIREKIFQPFFSTKGTGKGTGLGLSLSYDIVTKGHGGELKVESQEGKGTTFFIILPV